MKKKELFGVEIHNPDELEQIKFDAILCGSSSLAVNDEIEREIQENPKFEKKPFLRLCEYEYA
jgi:hypothetical protein